jgi:hypothetical protein
MAAKTAAEAGLKVLLLEQKNNPARINRSCLQIFYLEWLCPDGYIETVSGAWKLIEWSGAGARSYALAAVTIYVIDVGSGEVIATSSFSSKVKAEKEAKEKVNFDNMAFGGYAFYKTSLGEATATAEADLESDGSICACRTACRRSRTKRGRRCSSAGDPHLRILDGPAGPVLPVLGALQPNLKSASAARLVLLAKRGAAGNTIWLAYRVCRVAILADQSSQTIRELIGSIGGTRYRLDVLPNLIAKLEILYVLRQVVQA